MHTEYTVNSPESVSRILAMMMITDAKLDDRELDVLDKLRIYELVGISKERFSQVVQGYCQDLTRAGNSAGRIQLVDKARIDRIVDRVDDPGTRLKTCRMLLNIAGADGALHDAELAVFRYILERWGLTLESLHAQITQH
jgi:uncharacterized tellurite resistance protein B-like protein